MTGGVDESGGWVSSSHSYFWPGRVIIGINDLRVIW